MLSPPGVRTTGLAETVRERDERAVRLRRAMGGSLGSGGRQIERACKSQRMWVAAVPAEPACGWCCSVWIVRVPSRAGDRVVRGTVSTMGAALEVVEKGLGQGQTAASLHPV